MFTGLIEDVGELLRLEPRVSGARLHIATRIPLEQVRLGDSVAVCGACLTVVERGDHAFSAEISRETAARTTLATSRPGAPLHLERAMRLSDRLDGHLVLGHVDGLGRVRRRQEQGDSLLLELEAPPEVRRLLVEKGSVAVHGVSLTVNAVLHDGFSVTLVPFTRARSFLDQLQVGAPVNLEADLIGKYVERLLVGRSAPPLGGLTLEQLARGGFLDSD